MSALEVLGGSACLDFQVDYYGRRLGACGDDGVKVFDVGRVLRESDLGSCEASSTVSDVEGGVLRVSWSDPRYGILLGVGTRSGRVCVYRLVGETQWDLVYRSESLPGVIRGLEFANGDEGLVLGCCLGSGYVFVFRHNKSTQAWEVSKFLAHPNGMNAFAWGATRTSDHATDDDDSHAMIVTGGRDRQVKVWRLHAGEWSLAHGLPGRHLGAVTSVAWRPSDEATDRGKKGAMMATSSLDFTTIIWAFDTESAQWRIQDRIITPSPVISLSWSTNGHILNLTDKTKINRLFTQNAQDTWEPFQRPIAAIQDSPPGLTAVPTPPIGVSANRTSANGVSANGISGVPGVSAQTSHPSQLPDTAQHARGVPKDGPPLGM